MKPHHAAVLAFVLLAGCGTGLPVVAPELTEWEIMQPPQIGGRASNPDETAPLSKWTPVDTHKYPTQNECEQRLESLRESARNYPAGLAQIAKPIINLYDESRCVSTNDPNLKSN
jgi:hypothetical protein